VLVAEYVRRDECGVGPQQVDQSQGQEGSLAQARSRRHRRLVGHTGEEHAMGQTAERGGREILDCSDG